MVAMTLEALQDQLDRSLAWRKKEIAALRRAATRASTSRSYYCRAGTVMLCAHWEGFLKDAVGKYLKFVFSRNLGADRLAPPFVAIAFYGCVKRAADATFPGAEHHHIELAKKIQAGGRLVADWDVSTGGNPSSAVFSDILRSIGLDPHLGKDVAEWSVLKVFIDSQILADRHKIAHGEGLPVPHEEFYGRSSRVIEICEELAGAIMKAAKSKEYLLPG
ncbi:MAE_28990/MAE_18760 family HEPN-like nuclease [Pseudoxanthomonas suwonensis]|uniref:MAE_28990/MAE_18760 family HEPN-like nuclease n=1 Tax=Pseudoxanthomonas suwonensis TaxID=314722 RepID=UPI0012DC0887|nr:MAE_28990/MAE_18760 family HEPN-like nuclease [Pseudoxanthomonas suwonensis]